MRKCVDILHVIITSYKSVHSNRGRWWSTPFLHLHYRFESLPLSILKFQGWSAWICNISEMGHVRAYISYSRLQFDRERISFQYHTQQRRTFLFLALQCGRTELNKLFIYNINVILCKSVYRIRMFYIDYISVNVSNNKYQIKRTSYIPRIVFIFLSCFRVSLSK